MRVKSFKPLLKLRRNKAMNLSLSTDLHQQILLLLPWYLNQSLQVDERQQVENHVRHCLQCRRELVSLQKLAKTVIEPSALELAAEASFANLRGKLPSQVVEITPSARLAKFGQRLKFSRYRAAGFAMAASLLMAIAPLSWHLLRTNSSDSYYTLSAARPALSSGPQLKVVFAPSLSSIEVATILASIHGQKLDAPNSVGAFTIQLDSGANSPKLEEVIGLLRSRQDVLLAEPVAQP